MRLVIPLFVTSIAFAPNAASAENGEFHETLLFPVSEASDRNGTLRGGGDLVSDIIFINNCLPGGCVINAGNYTDSRDNTSQIPDTTSVLSPFVHSQEVWDRTIECVREVYGPYGVQIVTEDPGDADHHEAILAGTSDELGMPPDVLGVAPISCTQPLDNAISFSFANSMGPDWIQLCWTVAQESAHAFGMDHVFECEDPMTYIPNCGQKFFRNLDMPCGEFEERPCMCGGATQNSHNSLLAVFGEGQPVAPPELSILYPEDGATVGDNFVVLFEATDPRLINHAEVYVNGWLYETVPGHDFFNAIEPYIFVPSDSLGDGVMDIEVIAYNDMGASATDTISIVRNAPCADAGSCVDGQECRDGGCYWPTPTGQLGDSCAREMDCESLLCPQSEGDGVRLCSQYCQIGFQGECPAAYDCLPLREDPMTGVCWPIPVAEDSTCNASGNSSLSSGGLALILLVFMALAWRRRTGLDHRG